MLLKEPIDAPEPRHEWTLWKACYEALLVEMHRSAIRSSLRLRIAIGLVAEERSPKAYPVDNESSRTARIRSRIRLVCVGSRSFWPLTRDHICRPISDT